MKVIKSQNNQIKSLVLAALVVFIQHSLVWAQPNFPVSGGNAGDLLGDPVFLKANAFRDLFRYEESAAEFLVIAESNPGTEIEAVARSWYASDLQLFANQLEQQGNLVRAEELKAQSQLAWQSVASSFPGTKYWIKARARLADSSTDIDALLVEAGGVAREEVRTGQVTQLREADIPLPYRQFLMDLYEVGGETPEERLLFRKFVRLTFPSLSSGSLRDLYRPEGGFNDFLDSTAPVILVQSPLDGAEVSPSNAGLIAELNDGNLMGRQIDLAATVVELDGENILPQSTLSSNLDPNGPVFERLGIRYSPDVPLTEGSHTYRIFTTERGEGLSSEIVINFTVKSLPPNPTSLTLPATQDSTIRAQNPHRNEGANPRLFLSHRPEVRNKSNNPIVAFDLANTNLNGLTKASLVLNVQECDVPRRWGRNGRAIIVQPMNQPWLEGNGRFKGVRGNQGKTKGNGQGVTWFSPVDDEIRNNRPNGSLQWIGARNVIGPATAPAVRIQNRQTGPVVFDVTQDVMTGFKDGWMVRKQNEGKFGNIRFFSREGAAEVGDNNLAPQLILEYGSQVGQSDSRSILASIGLGEQPTKLESRYGRSEIKTFREFLLMNPVAGSIGEGMVSKLAGSNPLVNVPSRLAYRVWLNQGLV